MSDFKIRISVKGLFFNSQNEVLLVKSDDKSFWCVPGGGLEEGESITEAVERELTEETGYFGKVDRIVFVQDLEFVTKTRQLELFFSGKIDETKTPLTENLDHEFQFFSKDEFAKLTFLPKELNPFEIKRSVPFYNFTKHDHTQ